VSADPGLDGRSSRISGAVVTGRCSLCNEPIMAVRPADAAVEGAVVYVEECAPAQATGYLTNDGIWREGSSSFATLVGRPHPCAPPDPTAPPPPAMKAPAATKAPAKKAPARSRKKETP